MKMYPQNNGTIKMPLSVAQAARLGRILDKELPKTTGITLNLADGVDFAKVKNPVGGAIKHRFALVGGRDSVQSFANSMF